MQGTKAKKKNEEKRDHKHLQSCVNIEMG